MTVLTTRRRYLYLMASVAVLDFALMGVYVLVAGRLEAAPAVLLKNLVFLVLINIFVAGLIFRPIHLFETGSGGAQPAQVPDIRRRLENLPKLSMVWMFLLVLVYSGTVFVSGDITPYSDKLAAISLARKSFALVWFMAVFAVYYSFYIYFVISDFSERLRQRLFEHHELSIDPRPGRFRRKLFMVFVVLGLVPNIHLILDLTVFSTVRQAQGFGVFETVMVDLLAVLVVFSMALVFVTRSLSGPINSLTIAMEAVREGDLEKRVAITADDEIGVMSRSFNRMIERLQEQAFIRDTFGKYVPESVAASIISNRAQIEPKLTVATVLYTDIAGFTSISEKLGPGPVVQMLNEYFSSIIEPIEKFGGVVNQFQGDAILVTFNTPVEDEHHGEHALQAALQIRTIVASNRFAGVNLKIRTGLSSGPVVAGNVGSRGRYSYTVHGDTVNLAARIEQLNKELGTDLLVAESTVRLLPEDHGLVAVGNVAVRGKTVPVTVYGLPGSSRVDAKLSIQADTRPGST